MRRVALVAASFVVGALLAAPPSPATPARQLFAWSSPSSSSGPVGMSTRVDGPPVRRLAPGLYRIQVKAVNDMPFRLLGPGLDRRTKLRPHRDSAWQTRPHYTFFVTWVVRLKKGRYYYRGEGYWGRVSRLSGLRASGSFVVR
jgi:hypothetical protein